MTHAIVCGRRKILWEALEVGIEENAISKREEVFKHMSMDLVNTIRKLGWPDSKGHRQYGNAAILCFLSHKNTGKQFVEQRKSIRVIDLIAQYA
jgi:hypothetical protein